MPRTNNLQIIHCTSATDSCYYTTYSSLLKFEYNLKEKKN